MTDDDNRVTELVKSHLELANQVTALTRFMLGFIGDDNKLYPGVATRLSNLETKVDSAMRVLGRLGTWSLRLLGFIAIILALEFMGLKGENLLSLVWRMVAGA